MAKKIKQVVIPIETMPHLRQCEYCKSKDGKEKDVYETLQSAIDTAGYIEEARGIFLNVYKCPYNNGWHLTKNNATSEIEERKETILQNNDIPLKSINGTWEYIREEPIENKIIIEDDLDEIVLNQKPRKDSPKPIIKMECISAEEKNKFTGKIIEIIDNINIEKMFKINLENIFCANMIKNILDGIINQITIYIENKENNQLESYTVLLKKDILKKNNIVKGNIVKIDIIGKLLNNRYYWYCSRIENSS